ncbi:hypothetical protein PIB30_044917 [Stylosanthes scabra]|uniref:Uncharacterized protein n=1 Tax=Stylosanthes scabra TaxID=79078 RepID=A0ABU6XDV9_9FABA|nr:hypothetical protein [Stylosanthes scabra]
MEANRKRNNRGFLKGKLAPFYKSQTTKSSPPTTTSTKVVNNKPNHSSLPFSSSSSSSSSFGVVHHHHQDYVVLQAKPNPKVSIIVTDGRGGGGDLMSRRLEEFYGVPADESVDIKATIYISMVQERLSLERVNSNEPNKFQEKN